MLARKPARTDERGEERRASCIVGQEGERNGDRAERPARPVAIYHNVTQDALYGLA